MNSVVKQMRRFLVEEDGPTATEYAIMLALIILVAIVAITLLGGKVSSYFGTTEAALPT